MNRALNLFLAFLRIAAGASLITAGLTKLAWFGNPAALQEILGHSSIVTTQRYGRLGEAHVLEEARRLDQSGGRT